MAFPNLSTATASPLVSVLQGTIEVPIFDPPYLFAEIAATNSPAYLNPHSWWPLQQNANFTTVGGKSIPTTFIVLLATPFEYTKFQYKPEIATDRWGSAFNGAFGIQWFGNNLVVPGGAGNAVAMSNSFLAPLSINTTYLSIANILNYQEVTVNVASSQPLFCNLQGFAGMQNIGALVGSDYTQFVSTVFGNWDGNTNPPTFAGAKGFKNDLFHLADLSPKIFYCQPVFNSALAGNWLFFSPSLGNWTVPYVAFQPTFPGGGLTNLYKVSFDDPTLTAAFVRATFDPSGNIGWAGNFSKGHIWIANTPDGVLNQNQTIVVFSSDLTRYWRIKLIPQSQNAIDALATTQSWQLKIDPLGVFYFKAPGTVGNPSNRQRLFSSKAFNFAFQFPTANLSFGHLPCFQPCYPFMSRNGGMV